MLTVVDMEKKVINICRSVDPLDKFWLLEHFSG